MKKKFLILAFFCSPVGIISVSAQTDSLSREMEEVVVTATRAQVHRNNIPMTISVVNRAEIEESSESALLPVLSERIPGLFVTQRGITGFGVAAGGAGNISIRGVGGDNGSQVLVLIDGHPQFMGMMGHPLPDAYVASDVERVEVVRGPASILYGSNAMGGVINIITRQQGMNTWNASGRIMYGSHNTQKYMANAGIRTGKFNAYLSVNHDRTDGHRTNSEFDITNAYAKAGYEFSPHFKAWADVSLAAYETWNPGSTSVPMFDNVSDILRGVASVTFENNYDKLHGALKFFYNFGDHKVNDGYTTGGTPQSFYYRSRDNNYGLSLYQIFHAFKGNAITAGIDWKNYGGHAWNDFMDGRPDEELADKEVTEVAGYLIMQQNLFESLTLNAGVRMEHNSVYGTEWVPQAGVAYRPLRHTVIKVSVSKGFRSPTIRELYMFPPQNPDLQPERVMNYEVSLGQSFFQNRLSAELTGYIINGDNLISRQMVNNKPINLNSGEFKNRGVELAVRWNVLKNLSLQGNYSYLHMDTPLLYSPEQQAYVAANFRLKRWLFSANYQYVHNLYSRAGNNPVTGDYGLLNAKVSFRPLKWLDIFVKGENLTDRAYEIMYEYPMPGITVFGGITVSL